MRQPARRLTRQIRLRSECERKSNHQRPALLLHGSEFLRLCGESVRWTQLVRRAEASRGDARVNGRENEFPRSRLHARAHGHGGYRADEGDGDRSPRASPL